MRRVRVCPSPGSAHAKTALSFSGKTGDESCRIFDPIDAWRLDKAEERASMSRILNGHLALIGLGLLATTTSPVDAAATTQNAAPAVSPAARWLQLAIDTPPKTTPPPTTKRNDLPSQTLPKQGAPAGPSKSNLTPPDPTKKPVDQNTAKLVPVQDPKFGPLKVTPEAKAAYLALPPTVRAQLTDPKGGAIVSAGALQQMAVHFRGFKPPPPANYPPKGQPCGPPGTAGSALISDGNGDCHWGSPGIW
jgi:hypothetical protein